VDYEFRHDEFDRAITCEVSFSLILVWLEKMYSFLL
jgi:hypothetical protein